MKLQIPKETDDKSTGETTETNNEPLSEFVTFSKIKYRAVRVRLLVDLPADFGDERYKANAEIIAGINDDGYVCVPTIESNGTKDIASLEDGEFEIIECTGEPRMPVATPPPIKQSPSDATSETHEPDRHEVQHVDDFSLKVGNPPELRWKLNQDGTVNRESYREIPEDIHAAELAYLEAGHECKRIADEISRLQAEHEIAIDRRKSLGVDLCRVLEKRIRETLDETECEVKIKGNKEPSQVAEKPAAESPISEQPTGDYSNLSAPISELWSTPIERFGKKKQDALLAACPTIGDFERLREQAGRSFKPLHEMLPDGIGQGVADELEERQLSWMTKNLQQVSDDSTVGNDDKTIQPKTETEETESHDEIGGDEHREDDEAGQNYNPYNFG